MPIAKKVAEKVVKKAAERVKKVSSKKTVVKPKKVKEPKSSIVYQFADKEYDLNKMILLNSLLNYLKLYLLF